MLRSTCHRTPSAAVLRLRADAAPVQPPGEAANLCPPMPWCVLLIPAGPVTLSDATLPTLSVRSAAPRLFGPGHATFALRHPAASRPTVLWLDPLSVRATLGIEWNAWHAAHRLGMQLDSATARRLWIAADRDAAPGAGIVRQALRSVLATAGAIRVDALAAANGCTERHLERLFNAATGFAPKRFARIVRAWRTLVALINAPASRYGDLAVAHGFTDQAHLCREIRALTGFSLSALVAGLGPSGRRQLTAPDALPSPHDIAA